MISYFLCDNWYTCDSIMDSFIKYYAYRYEGNLNDIENAVVLITYPKDVCGKVASGSIFRQSKDKLAFERYQIRSSEWIQKYWLLVSLADLVMWHMVLMDMSTVLLKKKS